MAKQKHAAATEVTVAPLAEATGFEKFVNAYWKHGLALFVVIAAVVLGRQYMEDQESVAATEEWSEFGRSVVSGAFARRPGTALPIVSAEKLEELAANSSPDTAVWALMAAAASLEGDLEFTAARDTLARLEREYPEHPAVTQTVVIGDREGTLASLMMERVEGLIALKEGAPQLFGNPEPPADAPRVTLETTRGSIEVALYPNLAPQHVENFLELCRTGQYDGTKFHRVMSGFMIQGGDRTSIDGPKEQWGTGDAGYTIPQEFSELSHFEGYLAAAKRPDQEESGGHQFYITLGPSHHLDQVHTVFGKVVGGMDVVRAIGSSEIEPGTDRPVDPATVTATVVK